MSESSQFWVYVIELDSALVRKVGPKGAVYVGETSKTPEQRFEQHKTGRRAARVVRRAGVRLREDLYPPEGPFTSRAEALRFERRTRNRLDHRGYQVYGGQGEPFMKKTAW